MVTYDNAELGLTCEGSRHLLLASHQQSRPSPISKWTWALSAGALMILVGILAMEGDYVFSSLMARPTPSPKTTTSSQAIMPKRTAGTGMMSVKSKLDPRAPSPPVAAHSQARSKSTVVRETTKMAANAAANGSDRPTNDGQEESRLHLGMEWLWSLGSFLVLGLGFLGWQGIRQHNQGHRAMTVMTRFAQNGSDESEDLERAGWARNAVITTALAGVLAGPMATPPAADAYLPGDSGVKTAGAILRNSLPISNKPMREVQRALEDITNEMRVNTKASLSKVDGCINRADKVLAKSEKDIIKDFAPDKKEAGMAALKELKDGLAKYHEIVAAASNYSKESPKTVVLRQQKVVLDYVTTVEESMVKGMQFSVPDEYNKLPQLLGRAELEMNVKLQQAVADGVTGGTFKIVLDGYNAPVSAGNFADLVQRGAYDQVKIQRADGFVVQFGQPEGDPKKEGDAIKVDGEVRRIPLEYRYPRDKEPIYDLTCEDLARCNELPSLPFNATGALAVARSEFETDSGATQMFFLLKESELTPTGSNLLDGRYAVFGFITEGEDLLYSMKVGDTIESTKIVSGAENLKK